MMMNLSQQFSFGCETTNSSIMSPSCISSASPAIGSFKELKYPINSIGRAVGLGVILPGLVSNFLTVRTFLRMGLDDSVNFVFFNLAISDFFVLVSGAVRFSLWYLNNPKVLAYFMPVRQIRTSAWTIQQAFFEGNTFLTTFLAVQRCLCVAMPLRFKSMFNRQRTSFVVYGMWVLVFVYWIVRSCFNWMDFEVTRFPNSTVIKKIGTRYTFSLWKVGRAFRTLINVFLRPISSFVVILCVGVMVIALNRSVRFRKETAANPTATISSKNSAIDGLSKPEGAKISAKDKGLSFKNQLNSSKERLVVIQVMLVLAIYLVTTIPGGILAINNEFDFVILGTRNVLSLSFFRLVQNLVLLNSAVNFFVYYTFNTKFRRLVFKKKA